MSSHTNSPPRTPWHEAVNPRGVIGYRRASGARPWRRLVDARARDAPSIAGPDACCVQRVSVDGVSIPIHHGAAAVRSRHRGVDVQLAGANVFPTYTLALDYDVHSVVVTGELRSVKYRRARRRASKPSPRGRSSSRAGGIAFPNDPLARRTRIDGAGCKDGQQRFDLAFDQARRDTRWRSVNRYRLLNGAATAADASASPSIPPPVPASDSASTCRH
jgi:hypothetical protein